MNSGNWGGRITKSNELNPSGPRSAILDTISTLRLCNDLQSEVIANMEHYQAVVVGVDDEDPRSGWRFGYEAELSHLHDRREALDELIAAVEKYCAVAVNVVVSEESE